ncbi:uncharacterized protein LOC120465263 isoform X2 [Pimephales promelas]|uniref:uncharacterized protein LOC120465263 isoform X2 n=1 Tax=Pimephales promelas TaxID=90988 RepID=UPI001955EE77|nr:uncharacterized protein LOC120465263 isoform X2 [Pimephales promelas]
MMGRGIMRVFGETLLVTVCFLHLSDQGRLETCSKPAECYSYLNITQNSTNGDPRNCTIKDVTIINNTALPADEGSDVSVTCVHNLTNAFISWKMDNQLQEERSEKFEIQNILRETFLECEVHSICGLINSNITITVNVANNMVIILLCVGAAAALLMMFAIAMKISLRRGQAQSRARKRQRQQNMENIHSTTMNTVSSYD